MKLNNIFKKYTVDLSSDELNNFIKWSVITCVGLLSLFLLVKTVSEIKNYAYIGEDQVSYNTISVAGKSEMYVMPDITTFSFNIEGKSAEVGASQKIVADKSKLAMDLLKSKGIREADIKTIGFYTNTDYKSENRPCTYSGSAGVGSDGREIYYSAPSGKVSEPSVGMVAPDIAPSIRPIMPPCYDVDQVPVGYTTTQSVEVKVRNIKDQPELVGSLIGDLGRMSIKAGSPYSTVDSPEKYQSKVRQEAIIKARQEAQVLAKALGVKIVEIIGYSDNQYGYPVPAYQSARGGDAMVKEVSNPVLPTGSTLISSDVNVVFRIK